MDDTLRRRSLFNHRKFADHGAPRAPILRRGFLAGGVAVAALLALGRPAASFEATRAASPVRGIPERSGVLPWRTLAKVTGDGWSTPFEFGPEVELLDGTEVTLDGYMMPYEDQAKQRQFLLTAYRAHCPYCMPGGMPAMVEVIMKKSVPQTDRIMAVRGPLKLLRGEGYGLLYQMIGAVSA